MTLRTLTSRDTEGDTLVRKRPEPPRKWKVLFHNDDKTPMNFVVELLIHLFNKTAKEAERLMLQIHHEGIGMAGIYTKEVAEMKTVTAVATARNYGYPLMVTMEQE